MGVIDIKAQVKIPDSEPVSAVITAPDSGFRPEKWAIILAHGAANDKDHSMLVALAKGFAQEGHLAMRFNFPYREEGRKRPDGQKKLEAAWLGAFRYLKNHPNFRPENMIAAGKSMGGRVASQLQGGGEFGVQRMIFYGYPLHAPGKKTQPRSSHFKDISVPTLFFSGTRDPLCHLDTLRKNLCQVPIQPDLEVIEGGDHSFKLLKAMNVKKRVVHQDILARTLAWLG